MARKSKSPVAETADQVALPTPRLKKEYSERVRPAMMEKFGYSSVMQAPKITKVVVNMGSGIEEKELESCLRDMTTITGQKPVVTKSRKAIAQFKLREGVPVGCHVTLRGDRALHFFDKLCTVALPRIRDFNGVSPKSFDGRGNYSLGLKEQLVFPEIDYDTFDKIRGMDITICTTAQTDEEARTFLKLMGLPLRDK